MFKINVKQSVKLESGGIKFENYFEQIAVTNQLKFMLTLNVI